MPDGEVSASVSETKKKRVLICDDSVLIRRLMRDLVQEREDLEILEAQDGIQAVDLYREHRPDIVFMDIVMPRKNGLEALTEIRRFDPAARVVIASSTGTRKNLKAAIDAGACDFIQKPFERDDVLEILRRNLEGEWD